MRITLTDEEVSTLISILEKLEDDDIDSILEKLKEKPPVFKKKIAAIEKAREDRSINIKEKIVNSINMMRMENKKITLYSLSKESGISYVTVRKYEEYVNSLYPLK
jgi:response regulator of citrate/malate metabolism